MTLKDETKWLIAIGLIAFATFANSIGGEFVYDDKRQIGRNPLVQDISLAGKALTSDVWAFKGDGKQVASNYWRPTFTAWSILNFQLFGLNPAGWHATNVLLHVAVCLMLFLLLRRIGADAPVAFAVCAVFAVHPSHSESVAWIAGSTDLLFALCLLGSLWFAENRRTGGGNKDLALALLLYALALGAKEVALVCLPLYYVLYNRPADGEEFEPKWISTAALRSIVPFAIVGACYFAVRWAILGQITLPVDNATPLLPALLSIPQAFLFYLKQTFFPWPVSINYPLRPVPNVDLLGFVVPLVAGVAIIAVAVLLVRRSYLKAIGLLLFALPLIPAFNMHSFPADQIVHDRYLYLPIAGIALIAFTAAQKRFGDRAVVVGSCVLAAAFAAITFTVNRTWANDIALWENAARVDPASASTQSQYGSALYAAGRYDEAITAYNNALDVAPLSNAYLGRAQAFIATNRFEEAVWDLQTVTEMNNADLNAYTLYQSYEALGVALERKNDLVRAERTLREARKRLPIYSAALTEKIAIILYRKGSKAEALAELEAAQKQARVEMLPNSKAVFFRLGLLYAESGDKPKARAAFEEFLRLTAKISEKNVQNDRAAAADALKRLQ